MAWFRRKRSLRLVLGELSIACRVLAKQVAEARRSDEPAVGRLDPGSGRARPSPSPPGCRPTVLLNGLLIAREMSPILSALDFKFINAACHVLMRGNVMGAWGNELQRLFSISEFDLLLSDVVGQTARASGASPETLAAENEAYADVRRAVVEMVQQATLGGSDLVRDGQQHLIAAATLAAVATDMTGGGEADDQVMPFFGMLNGIVALFIMELRREVKLSA